MNRRPWRSLTYLWLSTKVVLSWVDLRTSILNPHDRWLNFEEGGLFRRSVQLEASSRSSISKPRGFPTARSTAVFALFESSKRKNGFSIRRLENDPAYLELDQRDRSFARLLLATVERRQGQIDKVIKYFSRNPKSGKRHSSDILCEAAMRVGVAQLLFMDVAPYAALQETIEVLKMHKKIPVSKGQVSFVNAILRQVSREGKGVLESTSTLENVEPWLVNEWSRAYGVDTAKMIVESSMRESPIFISINNAGIDGKEEIAGNTDRIRNEFLAADGCPAELLPHGSIRVPDTFHGAVSKWPLYGNGDWWVQDPSATLPAMALYNGLVSIGKTITDSNIVDLCSAPGGKTAQLISLGFKHVTAVEVSAKRTKPLAANLKRLGMEDKCTVVVGDGRCWAPTMEGEAIQGVLVDAPCSATGVGSRRPDVLRKSPAIDELVAVQRELLAHTIDSVLEPGGILVYATCSLLQQESEDQINWALSRSEGAEIEILPIQLGEIPGFDDAIDDNGCMRVIPGMLPGSLRYCDGFFVARLRRVR